MAEGYLKRIACQIAAQLPDGEKEAMEVLELAREIVINLGTAWAPSDKKQAIQLFSLTQKDRAEAPTAGRVAQIDRLDIANRG